MIMRNIVRWVEAKTGFESCIIHKLEVASQGKDNLPRHRMWVTRDGTFPGTETIKEHFEILIESSQYAESGDSDDVALTR